MFVVTIIKFEEGGLRVENCIQRTKMEMKSVNPDQTVPVGAV